MQGKDLSLHKNLYRDDRDFIEGNEGTSSQKEFVSVLYILLSLF